MKLNDQPIWCVRSASSDSELADVLWQTTIGQLPRYIVGTGLETWEAEHTTIYDDEHEARADAAARLAKVRR